MSRLTVADYRAQHSDAEPLPDHLPYLACVDEVVLLQDRDGDGPSLGAIWELDPVSVRVEMRRIRTFRIPLPDQMDRLPASLKMTNECRTNTSLKSERSVDNLIRTRRAPASL